MQLLRQRQTQKNIAEALSLIEAMLSIYQHVARYNQLFSSRRYFAAIKAVGRIEAECAPVAQRFDFAQVFRAHSSLVLTLFCSHAAANAVERVPFMRQRVRRAVLQDVQTWFEKYATPAFLLLC